MRASLRLGEKAALIMLKKNVNIVEKNLYLVSIKKEDFVVEAAR